MLHHSVWHSQPELSLAGIMPRALMLMLVVDFGKHGGLLSHHTASSVCNVQPQSYGEQSEDAIKMGGINVLACS